MCEKSGQGWMMRRHGWRRSKSRETSKYLVVEVLENRGGPAVVEAIGRIAAKLDFLGLPVKRLHSDRAGEYQSRAFHKWCHDRGILRTFNDGDNFKGNGRAENAIAQVKRGARTLLIAADASWSQWAGRSGTWHLSVRWLGRKGSTTATGRSTSQRPVPRSECCAQP